MRSISAVLVVCFAIAPEVRAQRSDAPRGGDDQAVMVQYPNGDVGDLIALYETLTGFRIVRDNFVVGKLTVTVNKPISRAEAIDLIEKSLMVNGYSIVQTDAKTVQIVGVGKNPRSIGLPTISDPKDLPQGERVFSYLFKLQHLDATKVQQTVAQYLSPPKPYTSFLVVPEANAVWITEQTSVIRQLVEVFRQLDVPPTASPSPSPARAN